MAAATAAAPGISRLLNETLIFLTEGNRLPDNPSYRSLQKYVADGVINRRTGKRVYLESVQIGYHVKTTIEAYHRFLNLLNARS